MSRRRCCETSSGETHGPDCFWKRRHPPEVDATATLVKHATGKCSACGSTLCESPLPHRCNPSDFVKSLDYGKCTL